jgi:hypothetical protein
MNARKRSMMRREVEIEYQGGIHREREKGKKRKFSVFLGCVSDSVETMQVLPTVTNCHAVTWSGFFFCFTAAGPECGKSGITIW